MKYIISTDEIQETNVIVFRPDNWDDFSYKTLFDATYIDKHSKRIELGSIKIAKSELDEGWTKEFLPKEFEILPSDFFFSLAICGEL